MVFKGDPEETAPVLGMCAFCARFCWIIIGPIMMTSLAKMKEQTEDNLGNSSKFASINKCSDEYTYVDMEDLSGSINDSLHEIVTIYNLCIAVFCFMAFECCCGCGCFLIAAMGNGGHRIGGNCNCDADTFVDELKYYLCGLIKVGS